MKSFRRIITLLMWPMVFLLPFWLTFGKGFFGSNGWGGIIIFFQVVPVLLVGLLVINGIIHFNWTFKREHLVTKLQAVVLALLYCSVFLYGIFFVDGGDTEESIGSVATRILGRGFENISTVLSNVFLFASAVLLLGAIVVAISGQFKWVRSWKAWLTIGVLIIIMSGITTGLYLKDSNDPKVKDEQISYDLRILGEDINQYTVKHNRMLPPGSAKQVAEIGKDSQELHIANRAGNYTFIPLPNRQQFKLCATFTTDTTGEYSSTQTRLDDTTFHHVGYQCFTFDVIYP